MELEFSENTRMSGQELLFDTSKMISQQLGTFNIPDDFYENGYALIDNIDDVHAAQAPLEQFIASIDHKRLPLYAQFIHKIQLAKVDLIPVCHDIVPRTFQALHFDMGQPLISSSNQTMYLILALYKPKTSVPSEAKTRVVAIGKLLAQRTFGDPEQRLIDYVKQHGDGWKEPMVVNTLRLGCFARILDAVTGRNELINDIDKTTGQWFDYGNAGAFAREKDFFSACGLDLEKAEEQINVQPGQLLIVDNMRCVHGRIGPRKPKEIYQFLFGVKSATPAMIDEFRKWLVHQFRKP